MQSKFTTRMYFCSEEKLKSIFTQVELFFQENEKKQLISRERNMLEKQELQKITNHGTRILWHLGGKLDSKATKKINEKYLLIQIDCLLHIRWETRNFRIGRVTYSHFITYLLQFTHQLLKFNEFLNRSESNFDWMTQAILPGITI